MKRTYQYRAGDKTITREYNYIPVRYIIVLCKFYGISADWLLGLKDTME